MHELANMAANKKQEMNLPPPPSEFVTPVNTPTEKVRVNFFLKRLKSHHLHIMCLYLGNSGSGDAFDCNIVHVLEWACRSPLNREKNNFDYLLQSRTSISCIKEVWGFVLGNNSTTLKVSSLEGFVILIMYEQNFARKNFNLSASS